MDKELIDELLYIQNCISSMDKMNHLKILQILVKHSADLNENKYGVHVNLSNCDVDTIKVIKDYIVNTEKQEEMLNNIETIKQDVKDRYFN